MANKDNWPGSLVSRRAINSKLRRPSIRTC